MPARTQSSSKYLSPLTLVLILILAPVAFSSAQTASDTDGAPDVEAGASDQGSGVEGPGRGKGCCGRCNYGSGGGDRTGKGHGGADRRGRKGHGRGGCHPCAKGSGGSGQGRAEMQNAHFLVTHHDRLERRVEEIPKGVKTETLTDDPELLEPLRQHVREMATMLEKGSRVRNWDPLFAEIFEHSEAIQIEIEEIDEGVRVTETSEDEEVVKLIRAHARKIDQFLARGREACREETPLPADYSGR